MAKTAFTSEQGVSRAGAFKAPWESFILITDPEHPRFGHLFDRRALDPPVEALVAAFMEFGCEQTLKCVRDPESGRPVIVDGRTRYIAAREAQQRINKAAAKNGVEPHIIELKFLYSEDSELDAVGTMIMLNQLRREDDPINLAEKCQLFVRLAGNDADARRRAAKRFGCTPVWIDTLLKIATLPFKIKESVREGNLSSSAALALHGLPAGEQEALLAKLIEQAKAEMPPVVAEAVPNEAGGDEAEARQDQAEAGRKPKAARKPRKVTARDVRKARGETEAPSMADVHEKVRRIRPDTRGYKQGDQGPAYAMGLLVGICWARGISNEQLELIAPTNTAFAATIKKKG